MERRYEEALTNSSLFDWCIAAGIERTSYSLNSDSTKCDEIREPNRGLSVGSCSQRILGGASEKWFVVGVTYLQKQFEVPDKILDSY